MTTLNITASDRRALRGLAHHLDPVVMIGQHGATPAVVHEIDNALAAHELIKVRVHNDDRNERVTMLAGICETLSCAPVQHLGKLFILFRPGKKKTQGDDATRGATTKERPRHTDFRKPPERERGTTLTRPPRREPAAPATPARRRRAIDEDAWSDLPPSVRQRIDPNYTGPAPTDRERRPRARPSATTGAAKSFGAHGPRARSAAPKPPVGSAPTTRRRLRDDSEASLVPTTTKRSASDGRFRWKDKENWVPTERAPRPSTRSEPKKNVRGAARKPTGTQSRRRLKDQ
jgi:RNA-binding protein